jgi:predicted Rossmann fold flavoprotein
MDTNWDVIVVGAGAAGLLAGISAGKSGAKTLVLEKNRKPGVKILMSGGTRCNITHNTDNRGIVKAFGNNGKFLHSPLAAFSVDETIRFFNQAGVATKIEATGKIFPVSNKALDVLDALLNQLKHENATLVLETPVLDIDATEDGFLLKTNLQTFHAKKIILTTGGLSFPGCGTTGDGYKFAMKFGHSIKETQPALAPLKTDARWVHELSGVTIPDVGVTACLNEKPMMQDRGSFLFTHFGLSGPVILNVSKALNSPSNFKNSSLKLDFLPSVKETDLEAKLQSFASTDGKKLLSVALGELLPRRLLEGLFSQIGFSPERKCAGISKDERKAIVVSIKSKSVNITGTLGYAKAEVTTGGVSLDEVNSKTMESKLKKGLYLAGEILDLDGPIGGFNFQAAWSTGFLAGSQANEQNF